MKTAKKTKVKSILLILAIALLFSAACSTEANNTRKGTVEFLFEVTDNNGNVTSQVIKTSEQTVGAALLEAGIIEGTVSDFGLMVEYVNGIRADFNEDNAWWAFYIDGEMAMAGVDSTDIEEGVTYAFIFTPA